MATTIRSDIWLTFRKLKAMTCNHGSLFLTLRKIKLVSYFTVSFQILFKVWDHSSFKRDHLVAETEADVYSVLEKNGGKCSDVLVSLEMFLVENIHSGKYRHCRHPKYNKTHVKELFVALSPLKLRGLES